MAEAQPEGRRIASRYHLLEAIGRGGMGIVWRAHDEFLDREVAIKEVRYADMLGEATQDDFNRRTKREARAAGRLTHPNVVVVHDVVEEDGRPWIVMQLVESRSLGKVLRQDGPLPPRRVAEIGLQLLDALRAAHAQGVLHRDVKPENVLLADDGRVVLTDFGIATLEAETALTMTGIAGTPAFIPPERIKGASAQRESDLWSLGATLYAAVEGKPPHDRGGALPTMHAILNDEPAPPVHAGRLSPVLEGLLRKDPAERLTYSQAERLLRRAIEEESKPERPRPARTAVMPVAGPADETDPGARFRSEEVPETGAKLGGVPGVPGVPAASGGADPKAAAPGAPAPKTPASGAPAPKTRGPAASGGTAPEKPAPAPSRREEAEESAAVAPAATAREGKSGGKAGNPPAPAPARKPGAVSAGDDAEADRPTTKARPVTGAGRPAPTAKFPAATGEPPAAAGSTAARPSASATGSSPVGFSASAAGSTAEPPAAGSAAGSPAAGSAAGSPAAGSAAKAAAEAASPTSAPPSGGKPASTPARTKPAPSARPNPFPPVGRTPVTRAPEPVPAARTEPAPRPEPATSSYDDYGSGIPMVTSREPESRPAPIKRGLLVLLPALLIVGGVAGWLGMRSSEMERTQRKHPATSESPSGGSSESGSRGKGEKASPGSSAGSQSPESPSSPSPTKSKPKSALPDGWHTHKDPNGFSIGLPKGWKVDKRPGQQVWFRGPNRSSYVMVEYTENPGPDPKQDWYDQEPVVRGSFSGYKRIRIEKADYMKKAADWEFTWNMSSGKARVLNRGFVTKGGRGYAIYWHTLAKDWKKNFHYFEGFAATFSSKK
ncbi:serine/threonine protein kinase [Streptosporangium becharense]|uniref:non-specific serine/threonine protein kinase n=1 Tax=Streptosporangium becharense TaxID=1816182 RepID=A0A7W9ICN8_9ACTN|nr:serine/threonine protein kinase [Streptosporangium becharense]MBB2912880.1 serine/threonine protein kinase [Streptosporangium becharense]MBB5818295.1 serine/threonine protein kinase [Streptosporangium becharense]